MTKTRTSVLAVLVVSFAVAPVLLLATPVLAKPNNGAPQQAVLAACGRTAGCVVSPGKNPIGIDQKTNVIFTCYKGRCHQV